MGQRRRLALFALPVALLLTTGAIARARGPFWLGTNLDPDYVYLVCSLVLSQGGPVGHVDHPGTTVHVAGVAGLRLGHALLGQEPDLVDDVLTQSEMYLRLLSGAVVLLYAAALYMAGRAMLSSTGSLLAALLAQSAPFLSLTILTEIGTFKPEPVIAILATVMAVRVARTLDGRDVTRREVVLLSALVGAAVAAKITAAPLLAVPLVLARGWRDRLASAAACALAFAAVTGPVWRQLGAFWGFQKRIALGGGLYGTNAFAHLVDYGARLRATLAMEWLFVALAVAGVAALGVAGWRTRGAAASPIVRALAAVTAAMLGQLALFLKQPYHHRYLTPALALMGVAVALLVLLARDGLGSGKRAAAAIAGVLASVWAGLQQEALLRRIAELEDRAQYQLAPRRAAEAAAPCPIATYYRASSLDDALRAGNGYTSRYLAARLQRLRPGALFLYTHLEGFAPAPTHFENYTGVVPDDAVRALPCIVFLGSPGGPGHPFGTVHDFERASLPVPGEVEVLSVTAVEAARLVRRPRTER